MARRVVLGYLVKIVPAFVLSVVAWRVLRLSSGYHSLVASVLDLLHPILDPTGSVQSVSVEGKEFVFDLWIRGKGTHLNIMGGDLTNNTILLIALFLASPIKSNLKSYVIYFASALAILFALHVVAVAASVQYALASSPEVLGPGGTDHFGTRLLLQYGHFYELIGTYLFVVVLWIPYVVGYVVRGRDRADAAGSRRRGDCAGDRK